MTQVEMLRGLGYNFGQGHLFSPAVPSADLVGMLETVQMDGEVPTSPHDPANPK
jgi:sensor c-di-GMP phosphodiesterase-like protein